MQGELCFTDGYDAEVVHIDAVIDLVSSGVRTMELAKKYTTTSVTDARGGLQAR